ncbi:hypothetical protein [Gottfriedia acidiceleris]|uniref:Uncharacterized protein n=1 Tax=Gottfriedia acidiceleris TaxID=371036 RepID=A0ABY4JT19_9BACI|nr:hypothetical protein [Gottfriedia acidiceleris]UPM55475.1 hypothetical protein MY490_06435 [Gottfriedia acidiceleris]
MLQKIRIGKWLIEVDMDRTREFYNKDIEVCNCLYCKNYLDATKFFKPTVIDLFKKLGINPVKPAHLSQFPIEIKSRHLYLGNYYFVGRVLEGELCSNSNFNKMNTIGIENFIFVFSEELDFLPEGFLDPVLQISFEVNIPWILKENPED